MINPRFHPAYGLSWRKRLALALRMWRTTRNVWTGTSYKAHLAMAVKLFEIPPDEQGVVVECGCFMGGSTANLSLACALTGRQLIVYDSFAGLPSPRGNDRFARASQTGFLDADLEAVRQNVRDYGEIDVCTFRKGWFSDTLPKPHRADRARLPRRRLPVQPRRLHQEPLAAPQRAGLPVHGRVHLHRVLRPVLVGALLARDLRHHPARADRLGIRDRRRAVLPRPGDRVELGPRPDQRGLHAQGPLGLLGLRPRVGPAARGARARRAARSRRQPPFKARRTSSRVKAGRPRPWARESCSATAKAREPSSALSTASACSRRSVAISSRRVIR